MIRSDDPRVRITLVITHKTHKRIVAGWGKLYHQKGSKYD